MSTNGISAPPPPSDPSNPAIPAPQPDSQLDTRLAALTRREREIQQQRQAFLQEKNNMVPKSELARIWKEDRSKLKDLIGVPDEEWNSSFSAPKPQEDGALASLKAEIEALKQEKLQEKQTSAVTQFKQNLSEFISKSPEEYELISAFDAVESVYDIMVEHYREHQQPMNPKEACDYVEQYLFDKFKQGAGTKKIGSLFQQSQTPGKQPPPTLTGTTAANPTSITQRKLSPEESMAEAAKLIRWT